jgi:hypothetical protein
MSGAHDLDDEARDGVLGFPETKAREVRRTGGRGLDDQQVWVEADARPVAPDSDGEIPVDGGVSRGADEPVIEQGFQQRDRGVVPRSLRHRLVSDEPVFREAADPMLDEHTLVRAARELAFVMHDDGAW